MDFPAVVYTYIYKRNNIKIYYPVIKHQHPLIDQKINERIQQEIWLLYKLQNVGENQIIEMLGTFELKTNEKNVLSLTIDNYTFSGGAHGLTLQKGLTFDLKSGKLYQLKDLFLPNIPYVKTLSGIVNDQIESRNLPVFEKPVEITKNQYFYLADKCIVLFFQLYEILPYVYGFPYFPISIYDIQNLYNDKGLLGRMVR